MPQLVDPNFRQTVVLLCTHSEEAAFGVVVNRPMVTTGRIVLNLDPPLTTEKELEVWIGGPLEPERSWVLLATDPGSPEAEAGVNVGEGLYLSTSSELLRQLFGPTPPPRARLVAGYAGWGPGQLEAELEASAWLVSDVDPDLIFGTPADRMWEAAIRRLGADPASLQVSRGVH
jgi:putative transcriptional regulator